MLGVAGKKLKRKYIRFLNMPKGVLQFFFCYVFHSTLFNEYGSTRKHNKVKPELFFKKTCMSARGGFQTHVHNIL
jgi:hypothetical protein